MKKRTRRRRRRVRRFLRDVERGVKRVLPRQHRREFRARARAPARLRPTPRPPAPAPAPRRCRWGRPRPRAAELELGPLGLTLGLAAGPPAAAVGILAIIVPGILVFLRALAHRRPERRRRRREERVPDPSPGIPRGRREGPGTRRRARLHRAREPRGHLGGGQRARHLREVVGVERGHQRVPERRGERDRGRVLRVRGRVVGVVPTRRSFFWVVPRETYALGSGDPSSRLGTAFGFAPPHHRLRYIKVVCVPRELVGQIRRDGGERASLHLRAPGSREGLPPEQGDERPPRVRATGGGRRVGVRGGVRMRIRSRGGYRGGARTRITTRGGCSRRTPRRRRATYDAFALHLRGVRVGERLGEGLGGVLRERRRAGVLVLDRRADRREARGEAPLVAVLPRPPGRERHRRRADGEAPRKRPGVGNRRDPRDASEAFQRRGNDRLGVVVPRARVCAWVPSRTTNRKNRGAGGKAAAAAAAIPERVANRLEDVLDDAAARESRDAGVAAFMTPRGARLGERPEALARRPAEAPPRGQ